MSMSEVAQLKRQIELECEAARRGLEGLAAGSAYHRFIRERTARLGAYYQQLVPLIGEEEARSILGKACEACF
ncbi:hypothetical protein EPA93_07195 [Ktedonosporobacter rubrisoli]|uniref:Uncharacterized protein n=1 Tax=Ktedonosporobacter rubrisoli TaxID=2509675 RepID=A0A4P6JL51_KTERU|nr:hypothetical protein [Ktedonosporobacter rubrisoli]QBD75803.1 hypothetical protein EPA93_07195 [Ktedonosporobacter rubrisoli]